MERIEWQNISKPSLCRHCADQSSGFNQFLERIRAWSSNSGLCCQECKEEMDKSPKKKKEVIFSANYLWLCLECDQIFCGAESCGQPDGHISYHAINNHHQFAIQIAAWCFYCKSFQCITTEEEIQELNWAIKFKDESRRNEHVDFSDLPCGYIVRPMDNLGNTCFFNAILQNLLSMDALRSIFADLDCPDDSITEKLWSLFIDTSNFPDDDEVVMDHSELFASICSRVPNFGGHQQQDSHELLRYLFNEILAEGNSFIEDTFGGKISSTVSCIQCGNTSQSYESFLDISLAIPSNECSTKKDEVVTSEDNVLPPKKRICLFMIPKVVESHECQQKDPIAEEVEDDPEDCCGLHPCACNKDLGGVAELIESQQRDPTRKGGGEDQIAEVVDLGSCYGQQSFICDSDSSEVAKLSEGQQVLLSEKKDPVEFQDVLKADSCALEKSSGQNDNLDSDDDRLSAKRKICSTKRPRCALSLKFKDGIQSDNKNADPLSIEKCLDLFTAPEILSGEYVCDHCSNRSQDCMQTELQSTNKNEKFIEAIQLGGHEIMDEMKDQDENKDEGMDIGVRKVKMVACKRNLFFKAPCILTIHLKRFTWDANGISKKINSHVNIQAMLDLTPYMDPSSEDKGKSCYCLMGVVEHVGDNLACGHYVAYIGGVQRQRNVLSWFRASDLDVREVSLKEVLDSNAYILFYERI